ncbi:MAG: hypothetical protein WC836_17930 [Desulfobacula sp.]|jgi:hypothetical protein
MKPIETGNLNSKVLENPEKRNWFLGHFMDPSSLFHSTDVEIKWGIHKKGEKYENAKANPQAKSLAILVSGNEKFYFPDTDETIILQKEGDYVIWNSGVFHSCEMIEDTTIITIRWPSVPNNTLSK